MTWKPLFIELETAFVELAPNSTNIVLVLYFYAIQQRMSLEFQSKLIYDS